MKKLALVFLSVFLVFGCATFDTKQETATDLEKLAEGATAAAKARIYHTLTGGGSGALDSTGVAQFTDGDINFVVTDSGHFYLYHFNATATDAEESPFYIRPDDYSTAGVHYLINSIYLNRNSTPTVSFRDADNTDYDVSANIVVNCTDTGSGTEDCDMTISVMEGGTLTTKFTIDADGDIDFSADIGFDAGKGTFLEQNNFLLFDSLGMADDSYVGIGITGRDCGETLLQWDLVTLKNDADPWHKADANVAGDFPANGIAISACTDGNPIAVITEGVVRNDGWTLTAGDPIYLGTNAGEVQVTAPSVSGDCVQIVGWALDSDHIYFNFSRPYSEVQ